MKIQNKKKQTTNIEIRQLNNKQRKGTYIYIKTTNKPSRYYKWKPNIPLDVYKKYYEDQYIKNKKYGTIKQYETIFTHKITGQKTKRTPLTRTAEQYLAKIKKTTKISDTLKTGITNTTITNALTATNNQIQNAKKELLKPLVLDQQLLDILTQTTNFEKLKHRLETRIIIKDEKQTPLLASNIFNETPETTINKLRQAKLEHNEIDPKEPSGTVVRKLNDLGFNKPTTLNKGLIKTIQLDLILRKQ